MGIAFSLGFTIGPLIGALFSQLTDKTNVDWFMYPAVFAFLLSIADLLFVAVFFNETLPKVLYTYLFSKFVFLENHH